MPPLPRTSMLALVAFLPIVGATMRPTAPPAAFHRDTTGWHLSSLQCDLPRQRLLIFDPAPYDPEKVGRAKAPGVAWVQDKRTGAAQRLGESGDPVCRDGRCTREYRRGGRRYRVTTPAPGALRGLPTAGEISMIEAGKRREDTTCRHVPGAVFACMTRGTSVIVAGKGSGDLSYSAWSAENASSTPSLVLERGTVERDMGGKLVYTFRAGDVTYAIRTSRWIAAGITPQAELSVRRGATLLLEEPCQSYAILDSDRPW